ncbi:protein inturned isoform X1 [Sander lucioperca]|uniref:Protein inturned n=1 Tax=Sander lucioperca TaxID=283035 RepID=A0A8C9Z0L2_SANLU|nr:protein inturned isoform X1 [Sander lucioperca]XP_035849422.1 protein inturned isoform X1 [Sander lucioperca]
MASANARKCTEKTLCRGQTKEDDAEHDHDSDCESTSSSFNSSDYSNDLEPEWLDDIQKNGELFYLELSEGEEEAALAHATNQGVATNHVRFSEKEAEVITEENKKQRCGSWTKGEPPLKRLARILRRKRRPSQRRVGGKDGGKDNSTLSSPPASILKNQPGQRQGVMVQQQQLKEVCVYLNPKRLGGSLTPLSDSGGLLEALLGVVHRPSWSRGQADSGGVRQEERLTVHGLIPNSPAIKCGQILIGDVLVAVDDVDVASENIERVLSCIPGPTQVRLTLETVAQVDRSNASDTSSVQKTKASPPVSQLVRLLWGEDTAELQMSIRHIPHIVMYLSLKLDSASPQDEEEILYQYPVSEASGQLKGVRGIFLTLCDMLENVTGGRILSSSLLLGKQLVHVGYWKQSNNLLVIGLPADRVPLLYLQTVVGDVVRTLKVMYGSLDSAFCKADHAPRLDHFFCLFFQQLIQPSRLRDGSSVPTPDVSGTLFLDGLPAVRWLTLPPEIKTEVDTVLSDFESSDFGEMSEDFFGLRRLYVILGSCLFYKSYLIANHLPKDDLLDVCLYCQHYCLLPLAAEQRVGQLVIWREVFPQQRAKGSSTAPGYSQPQGRHFLLIVGLRHFMQCVLLEAGGAASPAFGSPGPDCVYVDQVKATLLQLEVLEAGIEERLNAPSAPCLSCADWFLPAATARDRLDSLASSSPVFSKIAGAVKGSSTGNRGRSLFGEKARRSSPQRSLSDSGSEGQMDAGSGSGSSMAPGLSPHSTPDSGRKLGGRRDSLGSGGSDGSGGSAGLFKIPRMKHPNPFYLGTLKKTLTERETDEMYNTMKLTSGAENTLFHYVLMETVQGIFIAPTNREVAQLSGSIHPQLIRNFHHCCLSIRAAFQQSLPARGRRAADRPQGGGWGLGPVKEHGVLFQCKPENWTDQRKPAPTMTYWVIGRMLLEPVPQEFYVCFHDSVAEVPVEMAFRLSFGLAF